MDHYTATTDHIMALVRAHSPHPDDLARLLGYTLVAHTLGHDGQLRVHTLTDLEDMMPVTEGSATPAS